MAGLVFKAGPEGAGDAFFLASREAVEIEDEVREVTIAEEEVGALEGLLKIATGNPEEAGTKLRCVRGGVEAVVSIH